MYKYSKQRWAEGVTACFASIKAPSSNPHPTKKKKEKKSLYRDNICNIIENCPYTRKPIIYFPKNYKIL
jgi:hypothetical protein